MNEQPNLEARLLERWQEREQLDLQGWVDLYRLSRAVCVREMPSHAKESLFARFFIRRMAEATPSHLQSAAQLAVLFRWFCAASIEDAPSLAEVEEALFRPSDAVCLDLAAGRLDRSDMEVDDILESRVADLKAAAADRPDISLAAQVDVPAQVRQYLQRKVAARITATPGVLSEGEFVRLDRLLGPGDEDGELLARPLLALLDGPTDVPAVWWGWMAGGEPSFACEWDALIDEEDQGVDPIVATVQLWNPVRVYGPTVSGIAGRLSASRHAAVRALAADFVEGAALAAVSETRGDEGARVARVTSTGLAVKTGTALSGEDDPRWAYQRLYLAVAEAAGAPAALAAEALQAADWLAAAAVEQISTARFVAKATDGSGRELEVDFQQPMVVKPVLLIQTRGGQRLDESLSLRGQQIEFVGGLATPPPGLVPVLASALRLPEVFANWPAVAADFRRQKRATSGPMRAAFQALLAAASGIGRSPGDVAGFLFPQLLGATRSARTGSAVPIIHELSSEADGRTQVGLCWIGPEPAPEAISTVELQFVPEGPAVVTEAKWVHVRHVIVFQGQRVDSDAFAAASFKDGVLKIELWMSPEVGGRIEKQ